MIDLNLSVCIDVQVDCITPKKRIKSRTPCSVLGMILNGQHLLLMQEAHVFSTTDGLALEVFVVEGWIGSKVRSLCAVLQKSVLLSYDLSPLNWQFGLVLGYMTAYERR